MLRHFTSQIFFRRRLLVFFFVLLFTFQSCANTYVVPTASAQVTSQMGTASVDIQGNTATLSWTEPAHNSEVIIYEGTKEIAQSSESGELVKSNIEIDKLSVTWIRDLTDSEEHKVQQLNQSDPINDTTARQLVHFETKTFGSGNSVSQPGVDVANAMTLPGSTTFRFTTFIRDLWVPAPDFACTQVGGRIYEFTGNDRGFAPESTSFKTRFSVTIDWTSNGNISGQKGTQPTSLFLLHADGTRAFVDKKTAPTTGMNLEVVTESTTLSAFRIHHSVVNPLCSEVLTGGIYYDVKTYAARSGKVTMVGEALRFPDHEYYVKDNDQSTWTSIFKSFGTSIFCLTSGSSTQALCSYTVDKSVTR